MIKPKMTLESILSEYTDRIAMDARWAQFKDDMRLMMYDNDYTAEQLIDMGFGEELVHKADKEIKKEIALEDAIEVEPNYSDDFYGGYVECLYDIALELACEKGWTHDELVDFGLISDEEYVEDGKIVRTNPFPAEGVFTVKE